MRLLALFAAIALATPAAASAQSMPGMHMPNPQPPPPQPPPRQGEAMQGMDMSADIVVPEGRQMMSALGTGEMSRDASGTAWQPDSTPHAGYHASAGSWMLMGHALLNAVYDRQSGPRGGDKA